MNISIIKDTVCVNTAMFDDISIARKFLSIGALGDADEVADLPDGYGIGDKYINGEWVYTPRPEPEPVEVIPPDLDIARVEAIIKTKLWVEKTLNMPLEYNGKNYSVTLEKQNLLSAQLGMFMMNAQAGIAFPLSWNASGEPCESWTFEELLGLANAITAYVAPIVSKQQYAEININGAETYEQIQAILAEFT